MMNNSEANMFSLRQLPSSSSIFSAYASLTGSVMLVKSMINQFVPQQVQSYVYKKLQTLFHNKTHNPKELTLIIEELDNFTRNQVFEACEIYLGTKPTPAVDKIRVTQGPREKNLSLKAYNGQKIIDVFQDVRLQWILVSDATGKARPAIGRNGTQGEDYDNYQPPRSIEKRVFQLRFRKEHKDLVVGSYFPYLMKRSKELKDENKVQKIHSLGLRYCSGSWGSMDFEHPATFQTLAMDPKMKEEIMEDLDRFMRRREFYKRVGRAWKRGYLLYGPPGTGKTSLIAAMANYLNFDIYDLELAHVHSNSDLRRLLISTKNRSIIIIEDIDCSTTMGVKERGTSQPAAAGRNTHKNGYTLSGLLNFIDGLWSSCGDERIIVFTTNHKDRLDPALLRPGRMDMHIHMSYCTAEGFKILASNYLDIDDQHPLFGETQDLIRETDITPAEVAEELMKNEDADVALGGLINLLKRKKTENSKQDEKTQSQKAKQQKTNEKLDNEPKL